VPLQVLPFQVHCTTVLFPRRFLLAALLAFSTLCALPAEPIFAQTASYAVRPGDTLASIASRHGTTVNAIMRVNDIADPDLIRPGQKLTLPPAATIVPTGAENTDGRTAPTLLPTEETRVYVAQPGDTLASVAARFNTTPARLAELNQRSPAAALHIGQPLRVPLAGGVTFETFQGDDIPTPGKYIVHVVQPGESAAAVAQTYGTSLRRTLQLNKIADPAQLKPGMKLIVPPPSYAELFADVPIGPDDYPLYPEIPTSGKWISVDLDHQRTFAWEGDKLIKSFYISSGKARTPTVTGVFRIWGKIAAQRMEGGSRAAGDYYNLPNVQWVQYFYQDYSFHGTYWHNNFGTPMSHGCVNMTNADAKWLYEWASPTLAEGDYKWHTSGKEDPGTLVIVYQ
jgi:LysM repeat protein